MTRREFLNLATVSCTSATAMLTPRRPNILLILADDLGFSDIGCYGSEIETPNLDRLARRGVRFTQFYNTARCCPTRASLLTGLYPHQAGVGHMVDTGRPDYPGYRGDLSPRCVTTAEVLRSAGYRTFMCGKWHVTPVSESKHNWPLQRGFQRFYGTIHGAGSYYDPVSLTEGNEPAKPDRSDYYYTDALAERAVQYIREMAGKTEPFFLYLAFTAPHWPLHARETDVARYLGLYKQGWDALRQERYRRMVELGIIERRWQLAPRDPRAPAWDEAPHKEWQVRRMAVYAAMVHAMDRAIGRVLEALERSGAYEDTLIMFLSDNGGCAEELGPKAQGLHIPRLTRDGRPVRVGNLPEVMPGPEDTYQSYGLAWANLSNTPFRLYKHWVHEGGIATPFIVHWPRRIRRAGIVIHQAAHIIDVMPTCLDAAGAKYPSERQGTPVLPLEGVSLLPLITGEGALDERTLYWEHEGNRAVRQGPWKLVSRHPGNWELYDMEADRTETNDVAARHPDRVREMAALYEKWAARCGVEPWEKVRPPK